MARGCYHKVTEEEVENICLEYLIGVSGPKIAGRFNLNNSYIYRVLDKEGVERRNQEDAQRRIDIDEGAFSNLDKESIYWLGFLMADGCVRTEDQYKVTTSLWRKDRGHLEKFRDFLKSKHPIKDYISYNEFEKPMSKFSFNSKSIVKDLMEHGLGQNKTFKTESGKFCSSVSFWRGMIDGDGSLYKTNKGYPCISLVGTKKICEEFREFVTSFCEVQAKVRPKEGSYTFVTEGKYTVEIAQKLYEDADIYLDRKMERYQEYFT